MSFGNLLVKLADNKDAAAKVPEIVAANFNELPANIRNELLVKLADNKDAATNVAYVVSAIFDILPEKVRDELLVKLADNKDAATNVAKIVYNNFYNLPANMRNGLLVKLEDSASQALVLHADSSSFEVLSIVISVINTNFDKLPKTFTNDIIKTAVNTIITYLSHNPVRPNPMQNKYHYLFKLPKMIKRFSERQFYKSIFLEELERRRFNVPEDKSLFLEEFKRYKKLFNDLPFLEEPEDESLFLPFLEEFKRRRFDRGFFRELKRSGFVSHYFCELLYIVAGILICKFDSLQHHLDGIVFRLAGEDKTNLAAGVMIAAIASGFDRLPEHIRNDLLLKLVNHPALSIYVPMVIASNFEIIPEYARNLLFKLAHDERFAECLALSISYNFERLPPNVREILF